MPANVSHEAHAYAEHIRERLPRRLQELREAVRLSVYALWQKCGVSRHMISHIESGESIPTLDGAARLAHGAGMTLAEFAEPLEQSSPTLQRATACDGSLRTNSHPFAKCGQHVLAR